MNGCEGKSRCARGVVVWMRCGAKFGCHFQMAYFRPFVSGGRNVGSQPFCRQGLTEVHGSRQHKNAVSQRVRKLATRARVNIWTRRCGAQHTDTDRNTQRQKHTETAQAHTRAHTLPLPPPFSFSPSLRGWRGKRSKNNRRCKSSGGQQQVASGSSVRQKRRSGKRLWMWRAWIWQRA